MYQTNRYVYVDRKRKIMFEVFAHKVEFADGLIERMNKLQNLNLKHKLFGFCKRVLVNEPPYELELMQEDYVDKLEEKNERKN